MITTDLRSAAGAALAAEPRERPDGSSGARGSAVADALLRSPLVLEKPPARLAVPPRAGSPGPSPAAQRPPSAGYAAAKTSTKTAAKAASSKASANDPLAFLKDRSLTIEEKLIRLLGYLNAKWDKEMDEKLKQIGAAEQGKVKAASTSSGSGSSGSKKGGGVLGSLGGIGKVIAAVISPASLALDVPIVRDVVKQVSGPVLAAGAAAVGLPALAPLALKYGPQLVEGAAAIASAAGEAALAASSSAAAGSGTKTGASSARSGSASSSSGSSSKAVSDSERQQLLMEIQRIQQKQQEMFGLVSNVLKSGHDLRMALVNNLR